MSDTPYLLRLHEERAKLAAMIEPLQRDQLAGGNRPETESRIHFLHRQIGDLDVSIRAEERRRS